MHNLLATSQRKLRHLYADMSIYELYCSDMKPSYMHINTHLKGYVYICSKYISVEQNRSSVIAEALKKFPALMVSEASLKCLQEPNTDPCPKPYRHKSLHPTS
jgi:hypothetical protein